MASNIGKLAFKDATKLSLNERFTQYRAQQEFAVETNRHRIQQQRQGTVQNQRLAQQMSNRPAVIAALRLKKRSLQQRLGRPYFNGSVRARLGRPPFRPRGFRPGTSPMLRSRLGVFQPRGGFRGFRNGWGRQGGFRNRRFPRGGGPSRGRGGFVRGRGGSFRGRGGQFRGNRRPAPQQVPSRQDLDNELDQYMAESAPKMD